MYQIPLWVYMAIMAAGTAAQAKGAAKADKERAKAMAEERMRRSKLSAENEASAEKSKQLFANVRQDEQARAGQIAQQIAPTKAQATPAVGGGTRLLDPTSPPSASSTVDDANRSVAQRNAAGSAYADAIARAGSFGSVLGDKTRGLFGNAQDIDMNSTSMRNWAQNVLPARMEYANQSGRQWNTAGDVLKLVGTIMAPMAMGGGAGAGSATQQIGAARFGDAAKLAQGFGAGGSIPFGSSFGMDALASAGSMGAGFMADPRLQELLSLQQLGHRLSPEDLAYINSQKNVLH